MLNVIPKAGEEDSLKMTDGLRDSKEQVALREVFNMWVLGFSSSVPERRPRMLLKCWVRFQPNSERVRRVGAGAPLEPSLRLPAAPEGKGGGMKAYKTLKNV